jgi:hypothetical protein
VGYFASEFSPKDEWEWGLDLVLSLRLQDLDVLDLLKVG